MVDMVTSSQDLSIILIIHSLEKLTKAFHKQSVDYTVNVPGSLFIISLVKYILHHQYYFNPIEYIQGVVFALK